MDIGLARITESSLVTQEGMTMGTVTYMSPEQARGEKVDHRTDIWSLDVVLYEMRDLDLPCALTFPDRAVLRDEPRFQELLRKMNLPF